MEATSDETARLVSRCSAPWIAGVSPSTAVPPAATARSTALPSTGLALTPDQASEPPQLSPTTSSLTGSSVRRTFAAIGNSSRTACTPA